MFVKCIITLNCLALPASNDHPYRKIPLIFEDVSIGYTHWDSGRTLRKSRAPPQDVRQWGERITEKPPGRALNKDAVSKPTIKAKVLNPPATAA